MSGNVASILKSNSNVSIFVGGTPMHINASLIALYNNIASNKNNTSYWKINKSCDTDWEAFRKYVTNSFPYYNHKTVTHTKLATIVMTLPSIFL